MPHTLFFKTLGEGPPLVILHGVFGSGENWATVSKAFAPHFTVYLPDQRNHGRSPHDAVHTYEALTEDLAFFAETQGLGTFSLIGHSMGGKVAMFFAQKHPELLSRLVVVDIAPRYYNPHHDAIVAGLRAVRLDQIQNRTEAEQQMAPHIPEGDVRQFLLKNLYRNEEGNFAWRINLPVLEQAVARIGDALPETPRVEIPTLFVKGATSRYISERDQAEIPLRFPNSQLVEIEGAGHWVQAEKPAEFAQVVLDFLLPRS